MKQETGNPGAEAPEKPSSRVVITEQDLAQAEDRPLPAQQSGPLKPLGGVQQEGQALVLVPAGFWLRVVAKLIDFVFVAIPFGIAGGFGYVLFPSEEFGFWSIFRAGSRPALLWMVLRWLAAYVIVYVSYSVSAHAAQGRSIGKLLCGIRVVVPSDACSGVVYFLARFVIGVLSVSPAGLGYVVAAFRTDKRALHDLVLGSQVVKEQLGSRQNGPRSSQRGELEAK